MAISLKKPFVVNSLIKEINFGAYEGALWVNIPREELGLWVKYIENFSFELGESYFDPRESEKIYS